MFYGEFERLARAAPVVVIANNNVKTVLKKWTREFALDAKVDILRSRITLNAAGTLFLKISFSGLTFLTSVVLARLMGAKGYGAYAYAIAWINLLKVFGLLGAEQLIVRETAIYHQRSEWGYLKGLFNWARSISLLASLLLVAGALGVSWLVAEDLTSPMQITFWIALTMLPVVTQMRIRQASLQGFQHIVAAQLPEMLIQPLVFLFAIAATFFVFHDSMTVFTAMAFQVAAAAIAFLISAIQLRQRVPQPVRHASARYQSGIWFRSGLSLLFISGIDIINARLDSIMVGMLSDAESVGIYVVSARVAELIIFVLIAGGTAMAPKIAKLHAEGELGELQDLLTRMSRLMLVLALPVVFGFLILGNWILSVFGPEFTRGLLCIRILSLVRLVHVFFGPVNLLLIMCGQEFEAAKAVVVGTGINFVLNLILIPKWGIEGAAAATGVAIIVMSLLLTLAAYKRLGIHSSAAGKLRLMRRRVAPPGE